MTISSHELGGRLPLADRSSLSESQQHLFDRMTESVVPWAEHNGFTSRTREGRFIGPFNGALLSPVISGGFLDFQAAEETHTSLTERVRQVVILAVGAVWGSAYELYAHSAAARTTGLPEETVDALAAGRMPGELSAAERTAWRFAHRLTARRRIEQPLYDEARAAFRPKGVTDMVLLIGAYQTVCGLLNTFEVPAPEACHGN
ncbi:carboxymuconolactone decarboxylase family protein [Actinoallomurus sp. NPDC052308]|uniref:carboxymuconolactone decarboxylase family protein n=1 Tax=Actinoallomurus sp. NPDC052308 TaxID=3155530 RepID=UPI0034490D51